MAKLLKLRRGTTSQHSSFTGAEGEVTVDTDKETLVVHNGSTQAGFPLLRQDMSNLPGGTIDNADVNASAAIAGTKISPNFGSQTITTTGNLNTGDITLTDASPSITFTENDANPDFKILANSGTFKFVDTTNNNADRLVINSDGHVDVLGNLDVGAGLDVTGTINATSNIATSGNITANNGTVTVSGTAPKITFTETNDNPDYKLEANGGSIAIIDTTNSATRFAVGTSTTSINNNLDVASGVDVTGNITVTGTVDGVDVAALNTTVSGNLTTSNIASNAQIPLSKLETITSNRIVGNDSGNAVPKELTAAEVRTIINVEDGATADQSASEILTAVKTVDGSGSGLDADLLDGQHGSYYSNYNNLSNKPTIPTNNNQLTNGAGYITSASFSDVAGGGTFTGDVTFDGGANAVVIAGDSEIKFNNGNWTGNHTKIQHHGNFLYLVGGSSGIIFREGGNDRVKIDGSGHLVPASNNTYNLGSTSLRWSNVYTNDLHLSNEGSSNDIDSTWGDWTIQEGESDLFLKNNRSGKKYKFNLTEVS